MASTRTTSVSIPQTAAAGGLTMTQPANTAAASYYKIAPSNYVTFGWNLTSLYATPTSLTLFATNTANGNSYPVGGNGAAGANTIPGTVTQIVWNPYQYEQQVGAVPLAVGTYRLAVWDERGPTAAVKGGVFNPYSGTEFALYTPVDVHVIPVEMDEDDEADELEFGSWSSSEDIMSPTNTQNFFAPLPAPVSTITYDDRISEDERDEIYAMLPESPRLRPTVVKDKMYQSASPASPSVPPILPTPTITRATAPPVEKVHPSDVFSDSDSSDTSHSDNDETDGDETEDDELPITPPQDVLDDFSDIPVPWGV